MTSEFTIAVHALVYLDHKNTTLSSEALAENVCTNPARIRKVMACMKRAGFVHTKEGMNGGYQMAAPASDITLAKISKVLHADMVKASWRSGDPDMECLVASGMAGIMDGITAELNTVCVDYLSHITIQNIEDLIFTNEN
ncbi:Rrf2 family transcriptional regulator [Bariatricus massiliensis]|uniref:Rrf2 family transcriptional regulator n=1 Tax=Bariatricus massiliensis TaxID=1745713 RepID=A0ABS8DIZ8_9FIRM|nr:Rrf2 family transcriptional regulator [Bariatricus massiliensis]MCB7305273.1 Rrf2 family transcriptional regulator [Bariatricus massiliensis]MCB7375834.1 Rrf2 family transcriptional regulator [Bariatricus massiliensis]MCB7388416.1 Rrf2 family transcriptional regulator [Bariatricus massiliensis]MCB7412596.1 Rrf2 family transcriptional regulator [Bariatricus massiliensis]MCQ5254766.1 Rrf2 family transcriptional regulator [Bariatricus massiliensis]